MEAERSRIKMEESDIGGQQKREARLIVAANRLPVTPVKNKVSGEWEFKRSSGGLVSAFLGVRNFKITWVGWVGVDVPAEEREEVTRLLSEQQPFRCVPVYLDEQTAEVRESCAGGALEGAFLTTLWMHVSGRVEAWCNEALPRGTRMGEFPSSCRQAVWTQLPLSCVLGLLQWLFEQCALASPSLHSAVDARLAWRCCRAAVGSLSDGQPRLLRCSAHAQPHGA